jgi:ABC-2 type transport system permease protein
MTTATSKAVAAATAAESERRVPPLGGFNITFLRLEVRRMLRNKRTLFFIFGFPVVLFSLIAGPQIHRTIDGPGSPSVGPYIMISMAVYGAMVACTSGGAMVAAERALGWSRQLRLTPLRPAAYITTKLLTAMVLGFIAVVVMLAIGSAFGVRMATHIWAYSGLAAWLGAIVFAAFGLFVGYLLPAENAMQFIGPLLGVMAFFGGLFQPISTMNHSLQVIAKFMPVYGVGALARSPLTRETVGAVAIANIVGWVVVFGLGAMLLFRRDTKRV